MDLNEKISAISTIPVEALNNVGKYINVVHSHDVCTQLNDGKDTFELDLFEGKLYIKMVDDNIKYKFIPSESFNQVVVDTIVNKESLLITTASDRLKGTLTNTYKDIF